MAQDKLLQLAQQLTGKLKARQDQKIENQKQLKNRSQKLLEKMKHFTPKKGK